MVNLISKQQKKTSYLSFKENAKTDQVMWDNFYQKDNKAVNLFEKSDFLYIHIFVSFPSFHGKKWSEQMLALIYWLMLTHLQTDMVVIFLNLVMISSLTEIKPGKWFSIKRHWVWILKAFYQRMFCNANVFYYTEHALTKATSTSFLN